MQLYEFYTREKVPEIIKLYNTSIMKPSNSKDIQPVLKRISNVIIHDLTLRAIQPREIKKYTDLWSKLDDKVQIQIKEIGEND